MIDERWGALRLWADVHSDQSNPPDVAAIARKLAGAIADGPDGDSRDLSNALRWAERNADGGETGEIRSAARTLVAAFQGEAYHARPNGNNTPPPPEEPRRTELAERPWHQRLLRSPLVIVLLAIAAFGAFLGARALLAPKLTVVGPANGAILGAAEADSVSFAVDEPRHAMKRQKWMFDGLPVKRAVQVHGNRLTFTPSRLRDGTHEFAVTTAANPLGVRTTKHVTFTIDRAAPNIHLDGGVTAVAWHPLHVAGRVERDARVSVDGKPAVVKDGTFAMTIPAPAPPRLTLVSVDPAGNSAVRWVPVTIVPRRPPVKIRAVHMTADSWADPVTRGRILALINQHRINAVEIDLKDEDGVAGFDPAVPVAQAIGAARPIYDLGAAVALLHSKGVRVIGRLVVFADPTLAGAAWRAGHHGEVVQTPGGTEYAGYGGFTNPASPAVRHYNIAIAVAAAKLGVDDILYDYIRRPDGPIDSMKFPGLGKRDIAAAIVQFLKESRVALKPYGTYLGASVFGVAATRPEETGQDVHQMAQQLDYVAPMVYPSHWGAGEYDVADPNAQPYLIVRRSLRDFHNDVKGTGARLMLWLQDFTLGAPVYGSKQVKAQIAAAKASGALDFLLWNPDVDYTSSALDPDAKTTTKGLEEPQK